MKFLAIIPARGGSKGIPKKNIVSVGGKPLIQWTIESAQSTHEIDRIIVSTDNPEIAEIAIRCGAEVPFLRPSELAQDDTPGIDPVLHAINWLAEHDNYYPDAIVLLQPTSPLRQSDDIEEAIKKFRQTGTDSLVTVMPADHHPYWMITIDNEGHLSNFMTTPVVATRRQDLPAVYALNGAIYIARRDLLMTQKNWYTTNTIAHVMSPERSIDVDTAWDIHLVNLVLLDRRKSNESD